MENTVYCVFQDYGSWDDYASNLVGIFLSEKEAEDVKAQLTTGLEEFRSDYPRPKEELFYDPSDPDAYEGDVIAYSKAESAWYSAVFAAEKHDMMNVNHYSVNAMPLNQLFPEFQYFLPA